LEKEEENLRFIELIAVDGVILFGFPITEL
jgi:hypothetical protein